MEKGSLLDFLRADKGRTMKFEDQIFIAYQVASGMHHLEERNLIHRDLAARNVLLGANNVAKICDFGLARIMTQTIYTARTRHFPLKWTAPEGYTEFVFTTKSDVWSYGILLMELFTFGLTPYESIPLALVADLVLSGYRMPKPQNLPEEIYNVMLICWHREPEKRPTFAFLEKHFENMDVTYDANGALAVKQGTKRFYEDHNIT